MMTQEWPVDFPENCPPKSAKTSNDVFYRLVNNVPPTKSDFRRTCDEPRADGKERTYLRKQDMINSYGLSLFKEESDIKTKSKRYSNALSSKQTKIVYGRINQSIGLIEQTYKPSHHTLWLYKDAEPEKILNQELETKP